MKTTIENNTPPPGLQPHEEVLWGAHPQGRRHTRMLLLALADERKGRLPLPNKTELAGLKHAQSFIRVQLDDAGDQEENRMRGKERAEHMAGEVYITKIIEQMER